MAFAPGTADRVLGALQLESTSDWLAEVNQQRTQIKSENPPAVARITGYLDAYDTAYAAYITALSSQDAGLKRADSVEFFQGGTVRGFGDRVAELRKQISNALGLGDLLAYQQMRSGGGKYAVRGGMKVKPPMERYL